MQEQKIFNIKTQAQEEIKKAQNEKELFLVEKKYLGRKAEFNQILKGLKDLSKEEKKKIGSLANQIKKEIEASLDQKQKELKANIDFEKERVDVTIRGKKESRGHLHPLSIIQREIEDIFMNMGFEVAEGPELETEFYNFDALNIPPEHPARDMQDTFWVKSPAYFKKSSYDKMSANNLVSKQKHKNTKTQKHTLKSDYALYNNSEILNYNSQNLVLRTQTSAAQVRYMEENEPPFRIIVPGRIFRNEATDASHEHTFHQFEALYVDEDINVANLKYLIQEFFSQFFKKKIKSRLRPSYFPFVEPGFEIDISCTVCNDKGCKVCQKTGWIEIAGAGMVHQNVFTAAGYKCNRYQGFAWGFGIERLAMMKYKIDDIRLFHEGDIRFVSQF